MYKKLSLALLMLLNGFAFGMNPGYVENGLYPRNYFDDIPRFERVKRAAEELMAAKVLITDERLIQLFHIIVIKDNLSATLQQLLDYGINPEALRDGSNVTPLCRAAYSGSWQNLKILLEHQANPNIRTEGRTPLIEALVFRGAEDIVKTLLHYKADPNIPDEDGDTALSIVIKRHSHNIDYCLRLVRILLEAGADFGIKNKKDKTALDIARKKGFEELVELIESYYKNPKDLLNLYLDAIGNTQEFFEDGAFNGLPNELREMIDERILSRSLQLDMD